jgi:hypothetical protein
VPAGAAPSKAPTASCATRPASPAERRLRPRSSQESEAVSSEPAAKAAHYADCSYSQRLRRKRAGG